MQQFEHDREAICFQCSPPSIINFRGTYQSCCTVRHESKNEPQTQRISAEQPAKKLFHEAYCTKLAVQRVCTRRTAWKSLTFQYWSWYRIPEISKWSATRFQFRRRSAAGLWFFDAIIDKLLTVIYHAYLCPEMAWINRRYLVLTETAA